MSRHAQSNFMTRRMFFGAGAVTVAGASTAGWLLLSRPSFAGQALSVTDAYQAAKAGTVFLIDVRRPDEWQSTGIGQGAYPLDLRRDDFVDALNQITGGDTTAPVALICARGVRSARLSNRLTEAGYTNIIDVPQGMLGSSAGPGWIETGLPLEQVEG